MHGQRGINYMPEPNPSAVAMRSVSTAQKPDGSSNIEPQAVRGSGAKALGKEPDAESDSQE